MTKNILFILALFLIFTSCGDDEWEKWECPEVETSGISLTPAKDFTRTGSVPAEETNFSVFFIPPTDALVRSVRINDKEAEAPEEFYYAKDPSNPPAPLTGEWGQISYTVDNKTESKKGVRFSGVNVQLRENPSVEPRRIEIGFSGAYLMLSLDITQAGREK